MKNVRSLNVIVCAGRPNRGKTTFAAALAALSASHKDNRTGTAETQTDTTVYRLDAAYMAFAAQQGWVSKGRVLNIAKHFPRLEEEATKQFWDFIDGELTAFARSTRFTLIIEGFLAAPYEDRLRDKFARQRFLFLTIEDGSFEALGRRFTIPRIPLERFETDFSFHHTKRALAANVAVASEFFCHLRDCAIRQLTRETKYQSFDDLGMEVGASDTAAKFECLKLDQVLPPPGGGPKRILDIGSQSGNFCFRFARMSPSYRVTGIDTNRRSARLAARYNTQVYELPNVEFKHGNAMDLRQGRFELVLAASVFHYFREEQQALLDKVYDALNPGGYFVLECGVSTENPDRPHVQRHARKVDGDRPCHFPNRAMLFEMTRRFEKTYEGPSVQQKGDPIPRLVFHFRKPPAAEPAARRSDRDAVTATQ